MDASTIADRLALNDLVYDYARAVDNRDKDLMRTLFAPDAQIVVPGVELDSLDDFIRGLDGLDRFTATMHCVHNHQLVVTADTAKGQCYCIASHLYLVDAAPWKMDWGIRYRDRYRRNADGWIFSYRRLIIVWEQHAALKG